MASPPDLDHALDVSGRQFMAAAEACPAEHWLLNPDADTWSPAQIVEHVVKVEQAVGNALAVAPHADEAPGAVEPATAEAIRTALLDRTVHPPAPPHMLPCEAPASLEDLRPQFEAAHAALRALERTVGDGLHHRYVKHGRFGQLNGRQWLVLLAAHAERHAEQLHEVSARLAAAGR